MKIRNLFSTLAIVALVMAFVACSDTPDSARLLPNDPILVVKMDVKQTFEKSGLAGDAKIKKQLKEMLGDAADEPLAKEFFKIFDDPAEMGIDFREPVFFGIPEDEKDARLVGAVHDADKFTSLLNKVAKEVDADKVKEKDGISAFVVEELAIAYDKSNFVVTMVNDRDDASDVISNLSDAFEGKETSNVLEKKDFAEMCARKGIAQLLVRGEAIAELKDRDLREAKKLLPDGLDLEDVSYLMDLEVNKGEAVLTAELFPLSDEWKKNMEKSLEVFGKIKGDFAQYVSKKYFAAFGNVDGEKLLAVLEDSGLLKELDRDIRKQVTKVISSLNGDFAIGFNGIEDETPLLVGYMATSDNALVKMAAENLGGEDSRMKKMGSDKYVWEQCSVYELMMDPDCEPSSVTVFGYDDGASYFSFAKSGPKAFEKPSAAFKASDLKGTGAYAFFNFVTLKEIGEEIGGSDKEILDILSKNLDYAESYVEGSNKAVLRLVIKDKSKTPLEILYPLFTEIYESYSGGIVYDEDDDDDDYYDSDDDDDYDDDDYEAVDATAVAY